MNLQLASINPVNGIAVIALDTPAVDIVFLRGVFEADRQADVDRADPVAYAAATGTPYHDFSDED